ncbi:ATP-binding cassette domain-containing protein [Leucobacter viscericola]|uniref:ATP-binding cassette domain-containing protein n=1 Tax=Leucobacter viscericola TaxID=2714935 RepID=A0A6G7XG12_9MICO|nr:ATP-binding cassette domain-containing protein [Leucobacter viscericola]QIK63406.1 ATP-binding cassette domain-containing protein [Leucobacter viscericola]
MTLTVREGEFVAIVGPSGAGKSTLLNILGLLDLATSGSYVLNGRNVDEMTERERNEARSRDIGFVFQASHMLLHSTTAENAALGLAIQGATISDRVTRVQSALERVNMLERRNELAKNLSGGERQRVAISRAIATEPRLLLADEPTGALDTENSKNIIAYLQELNRAGMTVVVITHDPLVAEAAGHQIHLVDGVLDDGSGTPAEPGAEFVAGPAKSSRSAMQRVRSLASWIRGLQVDAVFRRKLLDEMGEAISGHVGRPARSLLLLFAFLLGSGGLVAALGISQSAAHQVADRLTKASLDEVVVHPDRLIPLSSSEYDETDPSGVAALLKALEGVQEVGLRAPVVKGAARVSTLQPGTIPKEVSFEGSVVVADASLLRLLNCAVAPDGAEGLLSNTWEGAVAVVGAEAAESLGMRTPADPNGTSNVSEAIESLWVNNREIDVVGVIQNPGRDSRLSNAVVLSRTAGEGLETSERSLVVRTEAGFPAPSRRQRRLRLIRLGPQRPRFLPWQTCEISASEYPRTSEPSYR